MKWVDEFRDPAAIRAASAAIAEAITQPWTIMEVCGGQTHAIVRWSLHELLPPELELVHGPGCPVCVTPGEVLDAARDLAVEGGVILATYADMLRVPGQRGTGDLLAARAAGADVRAVASPLDALRLAQAHPEREVVMLAVGFETTAPASAAAIEAAARGGVANFSVLASHVRVAPAMAMILGGEDNRVQGFLAAGHVCAVVGTGDYPPLVERYGAPIVVTGFEPLDLLAGVLRCVRALEAGQATLEVQYRRAVRPEGNPAARAALERVFEVVDAPWRGLGEVPQGGLAIRPEFAAHDALRRFELRPDEGVVAAEEGRGRCRAADVLRGRLKPLACPEFGRGCTPERPLGAPMVSSEGACAAYYRHRARHD